jgi:hypothetical protein
MSARTASMTGDRGEAATLGDQVERKMIMDRKETKDRIREMLKNAGNLTPRKHPKISRR